MDGLCPRCSKPLISKVKGRSYKRYEVAHIYPLRPTRAEEDLLQNEAKLSSDPNDLANLIPLCDLCHTDFDRPRTVEGYRELCAIKQRALERDEERSLWHQYPLQNELAKVIQALAEYDDAAPVAPDYTVETVDSKTAETPPLTRQKIRTEVRYYFSFIQTMLQQMEKATPSTSELIASQVHTYYLAQSRFSGDKRELYHRVARWIERQTGSSKEASEVLASFFVQNCDILR